MIRAADPERTGWLEVNHCRSPDVIVIGGLERLLDEAMRHVRVSGFKGLLARVDRRLDDGKALFDAGFKLMAIEPQEFWWTDFKYRYKDFPKTVQMMEKIKAVKRTRFERIWSYPPLLLARDCK